MAAHSCVDGCLSHCPQPNMIKKVIKSRRCMKTQGKWHNQTEMPRCTRYVIFWVRLLWALQSICISICKCICICSCICIHFIHVSSRRSSCSSLRHAEYRPASPLQSISCALPLAAICITDTRRSCCCCPAAMSNRYINNNNVPHWLEPSRERVSPTRRAHTRANRNGKSAKVANQYVSVSSLLTCWQSDYL